jgi:CDP-glycerol glycerophosphotransferase
MKRKLKQFVKNNKVFIQIYYFLGSLFINFIKLFIKTDEKLILFVSFSGRQYSDSPKAIYQYMISDERFKDYKLVWAFTNPEKYALENESKIKIDTFYYYFTALKSRVWITNSGIERLLNFKGKNTLYVNTWHGTPIKMLGKDQKSIDDIVGKWYQNSAADIMLAETKYDRDIFSRIFNLDKEKFLLIGLPRNDELIANKDNKINELKNKFNIPINKKVILYAPTFREYMNDTLLDNIIAPPIDFKKWKDQLGNEYVVLLRAHYFVNKILGVQDTDSDFLIDVTNYESINELMIISDMLISDYSSVFFDYSLLEKPMYCFGYDYDEYLEKRGMYIDINKELPNKVIRTENELLRKIININYLDEVEKTKKFKSKYSCGKENATEKIVNFIYNKL